MSYERPNILFIMSDDHASHAMGQAGAIDECYEPEWELFDLDADPYELNNVYDDPAYADTVVALKAELHDLQAEVGDQRYPLDVD